MTKRLAHARGAARERLKTRLQRLTLLVLRHLPQF